MSAAIELSCRAYSVLVLLYPLEFRREFQREMTCVFRRQLGEGLAEAWVWALRELVTVALPMQLRNSLVIASAASLVGTSIIYLALIWGLTYTFHVHRGPH
ncbi:MAG: hypothetical protein ABSB15_01500 [Bryobacteraceae bacterium]|jgi:hypothetical protein